MISYDSFVFKGFPCKDEIEELFIVITKFSFFL